MVDLSEIIHGENEKNKEDFRQYSHDENEIAQRVRRTYYEMHTKQTVEFVHLQHQKWLQFDHAQLTVFEAMDILNGIVDESDPDTDLPNIVHAFQTAERIREKHPDKPWFQLTGLIHDLGKLMAFYDEPHWAVCGDTFPVGCQHHPTIVFGLESFAQNPDCSNEVYQSKYGIYSPNCGIDNLLMSWGHDEYLYQVLVHNNTTLPDEALKIIRYHSFYPWHDANAYEYFMCKEDKTTLDWVREFNKFDLYSKSDETPDIDALKEYYQQLIDIYCPGILKF